MTTSSVYGFAKEEHITMVLIQKKLIALMVFIFFPLLFIPSPQAYVLQGPHIIELMIEELGEAQSLFVRQKLIFYRIEMPEEENAEAMEIDTIETEVDPVEDIPLILPEESADVELQTSEIQLQSTLRYNLSNAFRSEISSEDSHRIHLYAQGETLTVIDEHLAAESETRFDLFKDLMLFRSRQALVDRLWQLGVDVSVSSLGRFEGQAAFVIGGQYPDESVSQIWLDKETFRPMRWIIHDASGDFGREPLEVRYLEWWKKENVWYPMRVEFFQNNQLIQVAIVEKLEINRTFPNEIFDIQELRARYPSAPPVEPEEARTEEPSEVEKTIQEFRKIYE